MRRDVGGLPDLPHLPLGDAGVTSNQTLGELAAVPQVHGRPSDVQERGGIGGATAGIKGEQDACTTRLPGGVVGRRSHRFKVSRWSGLLRPRVFLDT